MVRPEALTQMFAQEQNFGRVDIAMSARVVGLLLMFAVVCVCIIARGQSNSDSATGIKGVITVSPIRPGPVTKGSEFPTAAPLPNATFHVSSDEKVVTKFTTDTNGRFQISLKPGHYVV